MAGSPLRGRSFLSVSDLNNRELLDLLQFASDLKRRFQAGIRDRPHEGKVLGLLFQKPSLRTRTSFEVAMAHLGGTSVYLSPAEVGMGQREAVDDVAMVVSRYFDVISARVFEHSIVTELAEHASVPVINALSDGVLMAYIPLLEVLPEYQGQGIGRTLVERMLARLGNLYAVDLLCDPELQPFYAQAGMRPATGMLLRNYARQAGADT